MDKRQERGIIIAAMTKLTRTKEGWLVPSQSGGKIYTVDPVAKTCTCPDHQQWGQGHMCKHLHAVEITIKREVSNRFVEPSPQTPTTSPAATLDWTGPCGSSF